MRAVSRRVVIVMILASAVAGATDGPADGLHVVTPKARGVIATDLNESGDLIGFEWVEEEKLPGVIKQAPIFAKGGNVTYLPLLESYTSTFPAAVSDDGLVVGRVSKPAPPGARVMLRNQAFAWDAAGGIRGLGAPEGDAASFATGVTRDGRRVSGFSVGKDGLRACLWEREGGGWRVVRLPQSSRLGSNVVAISGGGEFVTAVDGDSPCLWSRDAAGEWNREVIGGGGSLIPRAVNDSGMVAGLGRDAEGRHHAVVWTRQDGLKTLPEPAGFDRSEATALNNHGVVVGTLESPADSENGPRAFVYRDRRMSLIEAQEGPRLDAVTAINDAGQVAGVVEEPEP